MADFSQNVSNSVRVFGGEHATEWGSANFPYTMVWGVSLWGEGSYSVIFNLSRLVSESVSIDAIQYIQDRKVISESITPSSEFTTESLSQGIWKYVFISNTTEAEERDFATYTTGSAQSTSYTCLPGGSTIWS